MVEGRQLVTLPPRRADQRRWRVRAGQRALSSGWQPSTLPL